AGSQAHHPGGGRGDPGRHRRDVPADEDQHPRRHRPEHGRLYPDAARGTTLEESSEKAVDAEDALMDIDGVDVVQTTIGGSSFGFGGASNEVTYQITTDSDADQEALGEQMLSTLESLPEPGEIEDSFDAGALGSSTVD